MGEEENSRGGKQIKALAARELARYREAEGGAEAEELTGDRKIMLDKLMDQDEEEPEVGENLYRCTSFAKLVLVNSFLVKTPVRCRHS